MLFIHVGLPKCASSFLQMELFAKDKRINFLGIIRDHDNVDLPLEFSDDAKKFNLFARGKLDSFDTEGLRRQVLENEAVSVYSEEDFSTSDIVSVQEKARRIYSVFPDAKIISVVRKPESLLRSFHSFRVRGGVVKAGFNEWLSSECESPDDSVILKLPRFKETVGAFCDVFGKENVKVFKFEDLIQDEEIFLRVFYKEFGLSSPIILGMKKRNQSLPPSALKLATSYPMLFGLREFIPQSFRRIMKSIISKIRVKPEQLYLSNRKLIDDIYRDHLDYIRSSFSIEW